MPAYKNIVGQKFGMLTVLEELPGYKVLCLCDCGDIIEVRRNELVTGNTKSCGCIITDTNLANKESQKKQ